MNLPNQTGILLINLGTPDAPTPWSILKFLRVFLSDKRVIDCPQWIWRFILYGIILPFRSFKMTKAYQSIWTIKGSPLRVITEQLAKRLADNIAQEKGYPIPVQYAMTYGNPSIKKALSTLNTMGVSRLIVLPLFPYYSATTTAASFDVVARELKAFRLIPSIFFIHAYGLQASYLNALAESIRQHWHDKGQAERLLFSFHGIPKRYERLGDTYPKQCKMAAKTLAQMLKLPDNYWKISFQSRFGLKAWVGPSTDECLKKWAEDGVQSVDVIAPSFAVECLETIQELEEENRHVFLKAGGKTFQYIPALNDRDLHVRALESLIEKYF